MLNPIAESMKGYTDLPIAIVALICGIMTYRRNDIRKSWFRLFMLIAVTGVLGTVVHVFSIPRPYLSFLWLLLYPTFYELIRLFVQLMVECILGECIEEKPWIRVIELIMCITSVVLNFLANEADIFVFVLFCSILLLRMTVCWIKQRHAPMKVIILIVTLTAALLLLALKHYIPFGVSVSHIICAIDLVLIYCLGVDETKIALGS